MSLAGLLLLVVSASRCRHPVSPSPPPACPTARSRQPILRSSRPARLHPLQVDDRFRSTPSRHQREGVEHDDVAEPHRNADHAATYSFAVKVTGCGGGVSQVLYKIIIQSTVSSVAITTSSVPNGKVKTAYSAVIKASGGCTAYKWAIASGALPTGISTKVSSTTTSLNLVGTPIAAATYSSSRRSLGAAGASRRCRTRSSFRAPYRVSQSPPAVCRTARSRHPIPPVIKASGAALPTSGRSLREHSQPASARRCRARRRR